MSFLENAWAEREEHRYPELFGNMESTIYPLDDRIFSEVFGRQNVDPRWLHYGVMVSPPNGERSSWVYITSGMSNPWETDEREEFSGLGVELFLETEREMPGAIRVLLNLMAFNILLSVQHYGDKPMLDFGDRVPFKIEPNLTHIVIAKPNNFPEKFELISGQVDLLQVVGITSEEFAFAKEHGSSAILKELDKHAVSFRIQPERSSVVNV